MRKTLLLLLMHLLAFAKVSFSQDCPVNIDFESGDFTHWQCYTGSTNANGGVNSIVLTPSPPTAGRHEIISSATAASVKDPYGKFPVLCPYGGKYSVKLGNDNVNAEAEGLSYTFQVPSTVDTFSFTYFYAVVFEDPGHLDIEQPRFFVTAYDVLTGNLINCASYNYISNGAIPGFEVSEQNQGVLYKNWSPVSIQFAGLANRTVRLEFKTADCTKGGHFGYAYVDVRSGCSNILATAPYCVETNAVILNAPYGFQSYTWYNSSYSAVVGNQQSFTLSPPPSVSGVFHVDMIPYPGYGCRDTADAMIEPLPVPDTPLVVPEFVYCQNDPVPDINVTAQPGNDLLWYTSATGGTGSAVQPLLSSSVAGAFPYYITQKVLFGCESFRKKTTLTIHPTPVASFTVNNPVQCQNGNNFSFSNTSSNLNKSSFSWDFADSKTSADSSVSHTYNTFGYMNVSLKVVNDHGCSHQFSDNVTIIPKPVAAFSYPAMLCENETAVTITDNSSVANSLANINKWWWSINGVERQMQNPGVFTAGNAGSLPVKLVVTTAEGCYSDTNTLNLAVRYRPNTVFNYSKPLCDNEIVKFTDASFMPPASTDHIIKWYWQFDAAAQSTLQNPSTGFSAGYHHVKLVTESEFGCTSTEADSVFETHAKPKIALNINDSCILRAIHYQAVDLAHTVDKWFWDFGNGLHQDVPLISRSYQHEGYRPLMLLAQTIFGCKDTIIRPFTIYDNKAFAGRDTVTAMDEPVQLNANGGSNVQYTWSPATGLDNPSAENPVAVLDHDQLYKLDSWTDKGCDSHSKILVKRFKGPELYIPSAFTPNGDRLNDVLFVMPAGIKSFDFFAVYNRYGQRIFYTNDYARGWDGTFKGTPAQAGTYIAFARAFDYRGREMMKKLAIVLIR